MHDLINDLAQVVAKEICSKLEGDRQQKFSNRTRHSSYIAGEYDTVKKFEAFDQVKSLRTFLPLLWSRDCKLCLTNVVLVDLLPKLGYLRVLSLSGCSKLRSLPSKMENLVNLHYLDIRGADSIGRMPFGISKLTNLQRLSDFIIGEGDGCHIRDLKYLSNLKGDFRLSGLENVNGKDAGETKLNEKQGIDRLLEQLVIQNYGGAKFSTWIADPSFKNMLSLELHDCKNCKSLPPIGRLLLKDLSISGLDQVHKIGAELFGENQSNGFASLESLCFGNMLNWEEWDLCEDDEQVSKFPSLRFLSISGCPLLLGRLPTILQSLQELEIYECKRLFNISAERIMLRFANFETFNIYGWKELGSLSQIGLRLIGHRFITIRDCPQLVSLETEEEILQLDKIPESNFPPALKELRIVNCVNLQYLVDEKENNNKKSGLPTTNLRVFSIEECENFGLLPKCIHNFTSLRKLKVWNCSADISFPVEGFPTNLTSLAISNASKIYTSLVQWGFNRLTSLQELAISGEGCSSVMSFPEEGIGRMLPPSLRYICIRNFENLEYMCSKGFQHLTSLQQLRIYRCPNLTSLPEKDMLLSLEQLHICNCPLLEEERERSKIAHIPFVRIGFKTVIAGI
ncbi:putative disease resistance RPP13-like protein 1 [Gossypium arboreum]|uniref:putative disease resistance RPP13-like protein 1 n=1 Tax=Gossypium arboreum TaxID=29729 RepID=UPI0022F1D18B|nr:putative disease resistance RPP13-like protein 1 [Gossypium arboreum]